MEEKRTVNLQKTEEISLKDLILKIRDLYFYLRSKWKTILLAGFIGAILGFAYSYIKKPVYTASTTFVLESGEGGGGGGGGLSQYAGLASMAGISLGDGGGLFQGDNIIELYKSRTMIQRTLLSKINYRGKNELLINVYIEFNHLREQWSKNPTLAEIKFSEDPKDLNNERLRDSVIGTIVSDIGANYLNVSKPDKKLSIVEVDLKSKDEFFAKSFNDQIVKNVNDFYIKTKTKKSLNNILIIQTKTDSVRMTMNSAINKGAAVSDATPNLNPTRQVQRVAPMQRSQFDAETNKAVLAELIKNLEMSKISLLRETPLIQIIDQPVFPLEKVKFGKVKGVLSGGLLAVFFTVLVFLIRKIANQILTN